MATTEERNKHLNRPRKSEAERRHRTKVQQRRLIALGMPEAKVMRLDTKQIRAALRHPARIVKSA